MPECNIAGPAPEDQQCIQLRGFFVHRASRRKLARRSIQFIPKSDVWAELYYLISFGFGT